MPFQRILVPTDFSQGATDALHLAASLAREFGSRLDILHVLEEVFTSFGTLYGVSVDPETIQPQLTELSRKRLDELVADARYLQDLEVETQLRGGCVPDEIVATATASGDDLIVISTHGRSGLTHLLLGSVTEKVVRAASCPVLCFRELPAWQQHEPLRLERILLPVDLSEESLTPLPLARRLARHCGAQVDLVHVIADPANYPIDGWEYLPGITQDVVYGQTEELARQRLEELREQHLQATPGQCIIRRGIHHLAIVQLAEDESHELIVMSTHGRTGLRHAMLGSVTEKVIRKAACPVLTVRTPEAQSGGE